MSAYRRLIDVSNRSRGLTPERVYDLETALSDIMLLGEAAEVEAARLLMVSMAGDAEGDTEPVLQALRDSLRDELQLAPTPLPRATQLAYFGAKMAFC